MTIAENLLEMVDFNRCYDKAISECKVFYNEYDSNSIVVEFEDNSAIRFAYPYKIIVGD